MNVGYLRGTAEDDWEDWSIAQAKRGALAKNMRSARRRYQKQTIKFTLQLK